MRPAPKNNCEKPSYPNRREFIRRVGVAAAGVGTLCVSKVLAGEPMRGTPKVAGQVVAPKDSKAFCAKTCGKQIDAQIKLLGSKDFKIRKQATARLITIGKAQGENKKTVAQKKALVLARMKPLKTAKDPEIAQRAKAIILAIDPPKKVVPKRPIEVFKGEIAIDH